MRYGIAFTLVLLFANAAHAQSVKSEAVATNGIKVEISKDEFADRTEFTSPSVDIAGERISYGKAFVGSIKRAGTVGQASIGGFVGYSGEWAFYESAILKGGEQVEFRSYNRKVVSCRYGCTYSESFGIFPTVAQFIK